MAADPISLVFGPAGPVLRHVACASLPRSDQTRRGGSMKLRRAAILSSVLLCFSAVPAFAKTLVVDNDGAECPQAEYNTIQQAVAVAEAGDKILVCPGLYTGTVPVGTPDLRIEAQGAPGEVVLQG